MVPVVGLAGLFMAGVWAPLASRWRRKAHRCRVVTDAGRLHAPGITPPSDLAFLRSGMTFLDTAFYNQTGLGQSVPAISRGEWGLAGCLDCPGDLSPARNRRRW